MSYIFTDEVGFKGNAVDAFNRLKVANPFTLFDSQHRYQPNDKWDSFGATGGTFSYEVTQSAINLITSTGTGSKINRETKRVFSYQPGKSLLVLNTFAMSSPKPGLRQRVGYFGITGGATFGVPYNGIYLEQNGLTLSINLASGSLNTTTTVTQNEWNGDPFDGSGASGRILNVSKTNILWTDIEWLGVGDVRVGFFVDGKPVVAHTFHNDNQHNTTYMTTACLPIRYELENITGQTGNSQMKQICSSVISDGGYEGFSRRYNVSTDAVPVDLSISGIYYPIISIRLNSNRLDSIIIPSNISSIVTTNSWIHYKIILNGTVTGGTPIWQTHHNGNVDYTIFDGSLGLTGGTELIGGYINNNGLATISDANEFNFQLGRTQFGFSDTLTFVATGKNNNDKILADLAWFEIV